MTTQTYDGTYIHTCMHAYHARSNPQSPASNAPGAPLGLCVPFQLLPLLLAPPRVGPLPQQRGRLLVAHALALLPHVHPPQTRGITPSECGSAAVGAGRTCKQTNRANACTHAHAHKHTESQNRTTATTTTHNSSDTKRSNNGDNTVQCHWVVCFCERRDVRTHARAHTRWLASWLAGWLNVYECANAQNNAMQLQPLAHLLCTQQEWSHGG